MTEAQHIEGEANRELSNKLEQIQGTPNPAMNPTVDLHRAKEEAIKEFVRKQGTIALDWYVPNFCNTQVGDLITERLPIETTGGRILFNCPPTQRVLPHIHFRVGSHNRMSVHLPKPSRGHRSSMPAGAIQSRTFSRKTANDLDTSELRMEELERIPLVKKIAAPADIMDLEEVECKSCQYCQLWKLYAEISVELKRKSKLSRESAVTACKVYGSYISDIL